MAVRQKTTLDMTPGAAAPVLHVSQYDADSRVLVFELWSSGVKYTPPTGAEVVCDGRRSDNMSFTVACTVSGSTISMTVPTDMTEAPGSAVCQITVSQDGAILGSANFDLLVEESPLIRGGRRTRYYYLEEVPSIYRATVNRMISRGILITLGGSGDKTIVDIGDDVCRTLVELDSMGIWQDAWYVTLSDIPAGSIHNTIEKLLAMGIIAGAGTTTDGEVILNLHYNDCRLLTYMDRFGLFDETLGGYVLEMEDYGEGLSWGGAAIDDVAEALQAYAIVEDLVDRGVAVYTPTTIDGIATVLRVQSCYHAGTIYRIRYNPIVSGGQVVSPLIQIQNTRGVVNWKIDDETKLSGSITITAQELVDAGLNVSAIYRVLVGVGYVEFTNSEDPTEVLGINVSRQSFTSEFLYGDADHPTGDFSDIPGFTFSWSPDAQATYAVARQVQICCSGDSFARAVLQSTNVNGLPDGGTEGQVVMRDDSGAPVWDYPYVKCTLAEYNAMASHGANTVYMIVG